jgi:hypothetical protein
MRPGRRHFLCAASTTAVGFAIASPWSASALADDSVPHESSLSLSLRIDFPPVLIAQVDIIEALVTLNVRNYGDETVTLDRVPRFIVHDGKRALGQIRGGQPGGMPPVTVSPGKSVDFRFAIPFETTPCDYQFSVRFYTMIARIESQAARVRFKPTQVMESVNTPEGYERIGLSLEAVQQ